jgi:hypothetical protein
MPRYLPAIMRLSAILKNFWAEGEGGRGRVLAASHYSILLNTAYYSLTMTGGGGAGGLRCRREGGRKKE